MSRLSFRPRPLDIHKKLPIVKSIKDFEDDDGVTTTSTRSSHLQRIVAEADNEAHQNASKKIVPEIPTPQFVVVDTYERDYTATFKQPTSYLRGRGARAEIGEFVEYDLDNEDEDWLQEFNNERKILSAEKFETLMFKLEVLDQKTRERAGMIAPILGSAVPVLLQLDAAAEALQYLSIRYAVLQSVYSYWKKKRERWQKPVLRRLQIKVMWDRAAGWAASTKPSCWACQWAYRRIAEGPQLGLAWFPVMGSSSAGLLEMAHCKGGPAGWGRRSRRNL
ncbi:hypothetical protein Taro_025005 [Colocasia esculenta]|uniref:Enhancer of polycomb-like protein n=1 Tax=Colocasia esculenta TaxID=4460 RepID=A0A843V904_COLES|nr:hypothetical protein [Colocasia esculenta]